MIKKSSFIYLRLMLKDFSVLTALLWLVAADDGNDVDGHHKNDVGHGPKLSLDMNQNRADAQMNPLRLDNLSQ